MALLLSAWIRSKAGYCHIHSTSTSSQFWFLLRCVIVFWTVQCFLPSWSQTYDSLITTGLCLTFRFLIHYSTLLESCVDNSRNHFGSFSLQRWLGRQSSRRIYRFVSVSIILLFCGTFLLASFRVDLKIFGFWCFLLFVLQTVFIICVCNNQLLDWLENELIYILSFVPGFASALPGLTAKLRLMKEKYLVASPPVTSDINVTYLFCLSLLWPLPFHTLFCILRFLDDCFCWIRSRNGIFLLQRCGTESCGWCFWISSARLWLQPHKDTSSSNKNKN